MITGALTEDEQRALLRDSVHAMPQQKSSGGKLGERPPPDTVWSFGYETSLPGKRPACLDHATGLLEALGNSQQRRILLQDADSKEPRCDLHLLPLLVNLNFSRVWARLYVGSSALGWHRDPDPDLRGCAKAEQSNILVDHP